MSAVFHEILVQPLLNALVLFYTLNPWQDLGIAIICVTIVIRLLLLPLSLHASRSQQQLAQLQPRMKEIDEKYKHNREEQAKRKIELWKEHRINPLSGCVPLLIQLPVLFALFRVFQTNFSADIIPELYTWIHPPEMFSTLFLGSLDLSHSSPILAVLAGIAQYFQARTMPQVGGEGNEMAHVMKFQLLYVMPVLTVVFAYRFPAGLALYWVSSTLFSLVQQWWFRSHHPVSAV